MHTQMPEIAIAIAWYFKLMYKYIYGMARQPRFEIWICNGVHFPSLWQINRNRTSSDRGQETSIDVKVIIRIEWCYYSQLKLAPVKSKFKSK